MTIKKELEKKAEDFTEDHKEEKKPIKNDENKKKILELEKCMKDKDKRISKLESKFNFIYKSIYYIFCSFLIIGSYLLWLEAWVFIASNGRWNIFDFIADLSIGTNHIPYTLEIPVSFVLGIIMMILFCLITVMWLKTFNWRVGKIL